MVCFVYSCVCVHARENLPSSRVLRGCLQYISLRVWLMSRRALHRAVVMPPHRAAAAAAIFGQHSRKFNSRELIQFACEMNVDCIKFTGLAATLCAAGLR